MWERKRILITVRTYPTPAHKGIEVSCTAGVTDERGWIRLFPVPYRRMEPTKRFKKYDWIEVDVTRARGDIRPESYTPNIDSISIVGRERSSSNWARRKARLMPMQSHCLCCLESERSITGAPTLGFFKPGEITRLRIEKDVPTWSHEQLAKLRRASMFDMTPPDELEKIPYRFKYEFRCDHEQCSGHELMCTDWEIGESYRKWTREYGEERWETKFRQKYEHEMIHVNDTRFYVGTLHGHPATWIIVGLFYPRLDPQGALL